MVYKMRRDQLAVVIFSVMYPLSDAYRILVVSPLIGRSHGILGDGVVRPLDNAGHEITYLTVFPNENNYKNVREIDISANKALVPDNLMSIKSVMNRETSLGNVAYFMTMMTNLTATTLRNPSVNKILNDPNEHFDVVVAEWMYDDLFSALGAVFNCPFIWLSTLEPHWKILRLVDELPNPAYNPDSISTNLAPFTFIQRVQELAFQVVGNLIQYLYIDKLQLKNYEDIIVPILRKRNNPVPEFDELRYNASLVLSNSHVSIGRAARLPQNYKPLLGYHINREVKPLPEDIKKLLDNAKHGVIYFSMGSNLKSKYMPDELKQDLLKMFGTLPQTVIWKFEEDLPNLPSNVHILHWAPQQSILAHPACILFITHGGILSTTEAIHFGVPFIGIPVFGDQFSNVDRAVLKGFGRRVDLSYTMSGNLKAAIDEILTQAKYRAKVKELSLVYHDRPIHPSDELVHWVEHVVKTKGAPHLRSPALMMPWYQKLYLDLLAVVVSVLGVIIFIVKRACRMCRSDKVSSKKKKN